MTEAGGSWTEERVELLGRLWGDGLSASQIAAALGGGVTRNAVIGKVHRLGLAGRAKGSQPSPQRKLKPRAPTPPAVSDPQPAEIQAAPGRPAPLPPAPVAAEPREIAIPVSTRVSILELRDSMCRWPLGDPTSPDFGFCGGRAQTGLPYCAAHCRVAYQPAAERRRLRA